MVKVRTLLRSAQFMGVLGFVLGFCYEAHAAPLFQLPFPCNQTWSGQTRTDHNPRLALDLNRAGDEGDSVVASAAGRVVTVTNLGNTSYGRFVVIDHGGGWRTYYAHLSSFAVSVGQQVSQGQRIGAVGNTGGSFGAHLHYEQRLNGVVQTIKLNGSSALYFGTKSYVSRNRCAAAGGTAATGTVNTAGPPLTVRAGPGTTHADVGSLADGARVTIICQVRGQSVTGTYGTSNLWDKLGERRFVADAFVFTGSDGSVAPTCQ
jgi:hypothetical protein